MKTLTDQQIAEAEDAVRLIRPILAGRPPEVQGLILADLLAIWIAGHVVRGSHDETSRLREEILAAHIAGMRPLIDINAKIMGTMP